MLDELGGPGTYNHYPNGWAMAFNTPFKMWKRYEFKGGTSDPCMISWPAGIEAKGELREQYHHAVDLVPTILDALGVEAPETIGGHVQSHFDGVSMRYSFDAAALPSARATQFYSMLGSRSIWHDGYTAVTTHPTLSGWGNFAKDTWELYHIDVDRSELHDLSEQEPERLQEMINLWYAEAGANGAFPLDDRSAPGAHHHAAAAALAGAEPLHLLPRRRRRARVPGGQHPQPLLRDRRGRRHPRARLQRRDRSERSAVRARLALRRPRALRQGQPAALRLQLRRQARAEDRRRQELPTGEGLILSAAFEKEGEDPPGVAVGTLSLFHGDVKVGEGRIKTQPGKFCSPARASASGATAATRSPTTTPAARPGRSPAARSTASPSTSAASPTSTSSARPSR